MKLIEIPNNKYYDYRLDAMFNCYKWDPQFCDNNTLSRYVLVLNEDEDKKLKDYSIKLFFETKQAEEYINSNKQIAKKLYLPKKILKQISNMQNYNSSNNIRLMRFDFHPDINKNWIVTEVNSDVPGGFAESSLLPNLARKTIELPNLSFTSFNDKMINSINKKLNHNGTIMLIHCTCFSDDRQVMQSIGDRLLKEDYKVIYGAADHIRFKGKKAFCILENNQENIDFIFRFTPLEWLIQMKPRRWDGYFNTITKSCNHPISIYAQSKRFPFVWEDLEKAGLNMHTWKELLPHTIDVNKVRNQTGYIFKPVFGRVGERISIEEACKGDEYAKILKDVKKHPRQYLAQKKFNSMPIETNNGEKFHICIGSYVIDGEHSGYYARISHYPRIDSYAADIPVLIEK